MCNLYNLYCYTKYILYKDKSQVIKVQKQGAVGPLFCLAKKYYYFLPISRRNFSK